MTPIWSRTDGPNGAHLSIVFSSGVVVTLQHDHPSFSKITLLLANEASEQEILEIVNVSQSVATRLQKLSTRVAYDGTNILFDGDVLDDGLAKYIVSLLQSEGTDDVQPWEPFVNFLEKLAQNPVQESRESLYSFISKHGLTIRPDGDFIAYKGVNNDFGSINKGPGTINGVQMNGSLPNKPGNVLEVSRSYVDANRQNGCSTGLHAGTYRYASQWGPTVVAVALNPRDVISVPTDSDFEKIRTCRYEVLTKVNNPEKEVKATVGETSAPVWTAPSPKLAPQANPEIAKQLAKAIKKNRTLKVTYTTSARVTKKYAIIPTEINGDVLTLALADDPQSIRTFRISRISKVKRISKD